MDLNTEVDLLRKVPMFSKIEPSRLKLLAFTSQSLRFDDGEIVFCAGDAADCAYVITEGEAEILDNDGKPISGAVLGRNQLVGELGVLTGAPRSAAIRAKGQMVALRISDEKFLRLLAENAEAALDVMRQLSDKLVRTHRQLLAVKAELETQSGAG